MTEFKLSDADREAIVEDACRDWHDDKFPGGFDAVLREVVSRTLAHLNRQQEPDRSGKGNRMPKELDITSEEFRVYTYADGTTFRIDNPATLHVLIDDKGGTSHRVVDVGGVTHRPERGWVGISWAAKDGEPRFVA